MGWKIVLKNIEQKQRSEHEFSQRQVRFGRDPASDLVIDHPRVSRLHFTLVNRDGHSFLEDSSRNGVLLRQGGKWLRVQGEIGLIPPVLLLLPDWAIEADTIPEPVAPVEEEQVWDQSVVIPAGSLAQRREAILVFDLCHSSSLASEDDHMAYHLKRRLTQIAEPLLAEHNRRFFKSTGDGFLATFSDSQAALVATIELENRIQQRNLRTSNVPIHYRLALHFGETWAISSGGEDIHGHDVNVTFRVEGVQSNAFPELRHPFPVQDRILCSAAFLDSLNSGGDAEKVETIVCGEANLKGIHSPTEIHWVITPYSNSAEEPGANTLNVRTVTD
ncbi:MAG: FHA domain-containing protein [Gammaproteobacteria bacterium]|nr:FHA domain-containing protein [Gammaproteobacteria bacterium]